MKITVHFRQLFYLQIDAFLTDFKITQNQIQMK